MKWSRTDSSGKESIQLIFIVAFLQIFVFDVLKKALY